MILYSENNFISFKISKKILFPKIDIVSISPLRVIFMNIIIKKHLLLYKGYKLKCSIGKSGITPNKKKEGDLKYHPKEYSNLVYSTIEKIELRPLQCKIKKRIYHKKYGMVRRQQKQKL